MMNFYANIIESKGPVIGDSYFLQTKKEIENWLDKMKVRNYVINENLTVDVNDFVNLHNKKLKKLPVKFNKIKGNFNCSHNQLTSLKGCPKVLKNFDCSNNKLQSLKYCAETVEDSFSCADNQLFSLEYLPFVGEYINIERSGFNISENGLKGLRNMSSVLLFELLNNYPYLELEKLEWKEIDWSRVKIDETVVALYEMIENNKNRKQCEFILEKFEELQLY